MKVTELHIGDLVIVLSAPGAGGTKVHVKDARWLHSSKVNDDIMPDDEDPNLGVIHAMFLKDESRPDLNVLAAALEDTYDVNCVFVGVDLRHISIQGGVAHVHAATTDPTHTTH